MEAAVEGYCLGADEAPVSGLHENACAWDTSQGAWDAIVYC